MKLKFSVCIGLISACLIGALCSSSNLMVFASEQIANDDSFEGAIGSVSYISESSEFFSLQEKTDSHN